MRASAQFWIRGGRALDIEEVQAEAMVCLVKAVDDWEPERGHGGFNTEKAKSPFGPFLVQRIKWHLIRWAEEQRGGGSASRGAAIKRGDLEKPRFVGMAVASKDGDGEVERSIPDASPTVEQEMASASANLSQMIAAVRMKRSYKIALTLQCEGVPLREIGARIGVSGERARQIIVLATDKLRRCIKSRQRQNLTNRKLAMRDRAVCAVCAVAINPQQIYCSSRCYGDARSTKICIEPGCGKPTFKRQNSVTGAWGGRRCKWHLRLWLSVYRRARNAKTAKSPATPEQLRERGIRAWETRKAKYGTKYIQPKQPKPIRSTVFEFECPVCKFRVQKRKYPAAPIPKYCSMACANVGRRSASESDLRKYYIDQNMTLVETGMKLGLDHSVVSKLLRLYGIESRNHTRRKTCKIDGCVEPVRDHRTKDGQVFGTMCESHDKQYKREAAIASKKAKDPEWGTRKCGRKPKPAACPKCSHICESTRLAFVHCLKGGKEWARPKQTKFTSRSLVKSSATLTA